MTDKQGVKEKFRAWFMRQWAEWDRRTENHSTQTELAAYLEIPRSSVAQYVRGSNIPEGEYLQKIAKKFGVEVYEVLGVRVPDDELRLRLEAALSEALTLMVDSKIDPNSAEGKKIITDIAEKYGFTANNTSNT